ncbi:MAG: hypothetical protein JXR80_03395 [Deltaproteobacteria bacterium]|nr:hypothetical protein [Deltaproteobacteria bacterium]
MNKICDQCGITIEIGEEQQSNSRTLCEDCYMDVLSPTRTCDPWAVHHAKSCSTDQASLTATQNDLLSILTETGGINLAGLADRLQITEKETERNLAALRHMEKIKARPENGEKIYCLWSYKR